MIRCLNFAALAGVAHGLSTATASGKDAQNIDVDNRKTDDMAELTLDKLETKVDLLEREVERKFSEPAKLASSKKSTGELLTFHCKAVAAAKGFDGTNVKVNESSNSKRPSIIADQWIESESELEAMEKFEQSKELQTLYARRGPNAFEVGCYQGKRNERENWGAIQWYNWAINDAEEIGDPKSPFNKTLLSFAVTMLSSGIVAVFGEILGMLVTGTPLRENRFLRWFLIGTFFIGLCLKLWYPMLANFVNNYLKIGDLIVENFPAQQALAIAKTSHMTEMDFFLFDTVTALVNGLTAVLTSFVMMAIDQLTWAPLCTVIIISMNNIIDHYPNKWQWAEVRAVWFPAVKTNWIIWIPAQVLNFGIIPPQWRVMFANFVAVGWNLYLAVVTKAFKDDKKA